MIKTDPEIIWYWHERIEEYYKSGMKQTEFCKARELDYVVFCNMYYRIVYKKVSDPDEYARLVTIANLCKSSGLKNSRFAKEHGVHPRYLNEVFTHFGFLEIIEKMRKTKESQAMQFIQVPPSATPSSSPRSSSNREAERH